jgi:hypothetical protein
MSEERRIDVRTLIIASLASAAAALITSQFWIRGTPIAAAVTPVLVTILSEMLHRPTDKIADRFTAETDALPEAAGADPPPPAEETRPQPARDETIRVYRQPSRRRRLPWGPIAATAGTAFVIGAAIVTVPELVTGRSLGDGSRNSTLIGGKKKSSDDGNGGDQPAATQPRQQGEEQPQTTPSQPTETTPTPTTPQQTTPTPQQQTTPAPQAPPPAE